jgi:hypothetical protein
MTRSQNVMAVNRQRVFIGTTELRERWGCSHMFVERRLKKDPTFPKVYWIGTRRKFALDEVEDYERRSVAPQSVQQRRRRR